MKYFLLFFLLTSQIAAKNLIITHSYNRPEFIELHAKTFKAFLQDEYEYIVFNDAPQEAMKLQIEQVCNRLGIKCFRIPQNLHKRGDAGQRHMDGIGYSLEQIGYRHDDIVVLIDSDMFLLKPFNIKKYLQDYDIAGELQGKYNGITEVRYLSPVLAFMDMRTLPNKQTLSFYGGSVEGNLCDVGGHTYYYLKNNPSVKAQFFGCLHIGTWKLNLNCQTCNSMTCHHCIHQLEEHGFNNTLIKFIQDCPDHNIEFYLDNTFLHYRGGSNWDNKSAAYHDIKSKALTNLINNLLT